VPFTVDHSDDDASQSDDPIKVPSAPSPDTDAEAHDPKEATDKKKVFPKTLFTLDLSNDYNTASVPITNVTLPLTMSISFFNDLFGCNSCCSIGCKKYTVKRYGVATSLYFECMKYNFKTCCRADLTEDLETRWKAASLHRLNLKM
jgi:hypothetical protein